MTAKGESQIEDGGECEAVYDSDDGFFYEGDSDSDADDNWEENGLVESHDPEATIISDDIKDRRCLEVYRCHKFQHKKEFNGSSVFELFKVRVQFNQRFCNDPFHGQLYGEIATATWECDLVNPDPVPYYSVRREDADFISLDAVNNKFALVPLSGPTPRPPFSDLYDLTLEYALKTDDGKDVFNFGLSHENPRLFGDDGCKTAGHMCVRALSLCNTRHLGPFLSRKSVGVPYMDPVLLSAYYSVFYGSWATVRVKMLKGDVTSFYGLIVARPCIFYTRIRLLTAQRDNKVMIQRKNHKGEIDESGFIKLTRSMVAVPSYASLIVGAALYDEAGDPIFRGKVSFVAKKSGEETRTVNYHGAATLQFHVTWECTSDIVKWNPSSIDFGP